MFTAVIEEITSLFHILLSCPFYYLAGISCAGCGMTRAWESFLQGNFSGAFYFHPLFWTIPIAIVVFLLRKKIPHKVFNGMLVFYIGLFTVVYLIRMFDPANTVVVFEPQNGLIYRLIAGILNLNPGTLISI